MPYALLSEIYGQEFVDSTRNKPQLNKYNNIMELRFLSLKKYYKMLKKVYNFTAH